MSIDRLGVLEKTPARVFTHQQQKKRGEITRFNWTAPTQKKNPPIQQKNTTMSNSTKKNNSKGSNKGKSANASVGWADLQTLQDNLTKDLERMNKNIEETDNKAVGAAQKLVEWNEKSDKNITALMEEMGKLKSDGEARESESMEDVAKAELEKFVSGSLSKILEDKIKNLLTSKEIAEMIGGVVKTLLGTKGRDGTIISVEKITRQGNIKSVEDLIEDQNGYYRSCINLYGNILLLLWLVVVMSNFVMLQLLTHEFGLPPLTHTRYTKEHLWDKNFRFLHPGTGVFLKLVNKALGAALGIKDKDFRSQCSSTVGDWIIKKQDSIINNVKSPYRVNLKSCK